MSESEYFWRVKGAAYRGDFLRTEDAAKAVLAEIQQHPRHLDIELKLEEAIKSEVGEEELYDMLHRIAEDRLWMPGNKTLEIVEVFH
jgi:hypothetical protein